MTKTLPEKLTPNRDEVLKALGAVPETEYKKLQEQLNIATKALKEISHWSPWKDDRDERAKEALKEMEEA